MNLKALFTIILISLLFLSCDSWLGVRITDEQQCEQLLKGLDKVITHEMQISEITLISAERKLTEIMGSANIIYTTSNTEKFRIMTVDLSSWKVLRDKETNTTNKTTVKSISNFGFSRIPSVIVQASTMIDKQNMELRGVETFRIKFVTETDADYEFDVYGKLKTTACKSQKIGGTRKSPRYRTSCYCSKVPFSVKNGEMKQWKGGKFQWVW